MTPACRAAMLAPGVYLDSKAYPSLGLAAVYVRVHGIATCGGPHLDVTFDCTRRKARRTVRVAVDGSWRCVSTLLPFNCYGETFQ